VTLTEYTEQPGDTFRLHFHSTRPLERFTVPLDERNPPTRDPPYPLGPFPCELRPLTLQGGPTALDCPFPAPFQVDSFFDVVYRIEFREPVPTFAGTIDDAGGIPIEGFEARPTSPPPPPPPPPPVNGSGLFGPGPNPNTLNFKVTLDAPTTSLDQFAIQVPPGLEVNQGVAAGFSCEPADLEGTKRALACNGPVTSGAEVQGGIELTTPRPDQMAAGSALYAAGGGTLYGPFGIEQNPSTPAGGGTVSPPTGATYNFQLQFSTFGALDSFVIDLANDILEIEAGQAQSGGLFNCSPTDDGGANTNNALLCDNLSIVNGQPITGSYTLTAPEVSFTGGGDLFGDGPNLAQPVGPFAVVPAP